MSMKSHSGRTCASCKEFPLAASMETGGAAACGIYERPARFNDSFCVLYERAPDFTSRKALAIQLHRNSTKGDGNAS